MKFELTSRLSRWKSHKILRFNSSLINVGQTLKKIMVTIRNNKSTTILFNPSNLKIVNDLQYCRSKCLVKNQRYCDIISSYVMADGAITEKCYIIGSGCRIWGKYYRYHHSNYKRNSNFMK